MADNLRPRLDRLQELAKVVNSRTDEAGRIVQGVERYLSEVLHLGVQTKVTIDYDEDHHDQWIFRRDLTYGRHGEKFRIYVAEATFCAGDLDDHKETLWANCSRDVKLMAFNALPKLLDEMVKSLEATLEQLRVNTETIESLLPGLKEVKA
jgi:hypothetical protein